MPRIFSTAEASGQLTELDERSQQAIRRRASARDCPAKLFQNLRPVPLLTTLPSTGGIVKIDRRLASRFWSVMATSSSEAKLERARELGADFAINYTSEDWEKIVLERTGGGADVIIDSVGQQTWGKALRALRPGGRLVSFGATTGRTTEVDIRSVFWNHISILGTTMGSPREFAAMLQLYEARRLKPVVDSVFALREAPTAHRRMDEGQQFGKIVLVPWLAFRHQPDSETNDSLPASALDLCTILSTPRSST